MVDIYFLISFIWCYLNVLVHVIHRTRACYCQIVDNFVCFMLFCLKVLGGALLSESIIVKFQKIFILPPRKVFVLHPPPSPPRKFWFIFICCF